MTVSAAELIVSTLRSCLIYSMLLPLLPRSLFRLLNVSLVDLRRPIEREPGRRARLPLYPHALKGWAVAVTVR